METMALSGNPMRISTPTPVTTHMSERSFSHNAPRTYDRIDTQQSLQKTDAAGEAGEDTKKQIETLHKSTIKFNQMSEQLNLDIKFAYNEKIDQVYLNVIDKHTGQVIRKLPSEEAMKISETMKELVGNLLDKKG